MFEDILELAKKATKGPWSQGDEFLMSPPGQGEGKGLFADRETDISTHCWHMGTCARDEDAAYLASVHPQAMEIMIAALDTEDGHMGKFPKSCWNKEDEPDTVDIDAVAGLAEKASRGPWRQADGEKPGMAVIDAEGRKVIEFTYAGTAEDAAYAASVPPEIVLDMVGRIRRLREKANCQ